MPYICKMYLISMILLGIVCEDQVLPYVHLEIFNIYEGKRKGFNEKDCKKFSYRFNSQYSDKTFREFYTTTMTVFRTTSDGLNTLKDFWTALSTIMYLLSME